LEARSAQIGPTQVNINQAIGSRSATLFRALCTQVLLSHRRTSGAKREKKHKSLQIADVGRTSADLQSALYPPRAKQFLLPSATSGFQQALPLAPTRNALFFHAFAFVGESQSLVRVNGNWIHVEHNAITVQSPCRIAAKPE